MLAVPTFPAASIASTTMGFPPSVKDTSQLKVESKRKAAVPLQVTSVTPDKASLKLPVTFAGEVFSAAPLPGDVMATLGGVLSRLTSTPVMAVCPARSVATPLVT